MRRPGTSIVTTVVAPMAQQPDCDSTIHNRSPRGQITDAYAPRAVVRMRPTSRMLSRSINRSTMPPSVTTATRRSSGESAQASTGALRRSRRPSSGRNETGATRVRKRSPSSRATPSSTAGAAVGAVFGVRSHGAPATNATPPASAITANA